MLGERSSPVSKSDNQDTGQQRIISGSAKNDGAEETTPLVARAPADRADAPKPDAEAGEQKPPEDWIKQTISEEWIDSPDKLAGRHRVRIVEADFKYPHLRLEEAVTLDPKTGIETVTLLRASVADHLMLGLKPGVDPELARSRLDKMGYAVRSIEQDSYILVELPTFDAAHDQKQAAQNLEALEEFIDYAEPDYLVFTCLTPNDPAYAQGIMWGLHNPGTTANTTLDADIDAPEAWSIRNDASGIIVAVTDTGIQYNHEDLASNMWLHPDGSRGYDAYDNDNDPMDVGGHGTHCAGTIGACGDNHLGLTGVAWNVKLMAVRFLGPNGGTTSDAIRSVNYARQNGANIINASWGGGGYSQSLYNAIDACGEIGIPFVAAAGNSAANNDSTPHYPSGFRLSNIVSVASSNQNDSLSTFSCYGRVSVDIAAPGSAIWSTFIGTGPNTYNSYTYLSGTSMATPHVSGALALAMAHFPDDDINSILDGLYSSTDKIPALNGKVSTGGRLNLARLLGNPAPDQTNDDFINAHAFEGDYGSWTGSNLGATREADEDTFSKPGTGDKSLWYAFNTPHAGLVSLDVTSELSGYHVVVFMGSQKNQLEIVAEDSHPASLNRQLRFNSKPNTEYRVVIDTYQSSTMRFRLDYNLAPANDFFAQATPLGGDIFTTKGYNRAATKELFEKKNPHARVGQGKSVWWAWTAGTEGDFIINTAGSAFDTVLAVYTGTGIKDLTEVASNDDRSPMDWTSQVTIPASAGTTYYIVVDSFREDSAGDICLNGFRSGALAILRQPASLSVALGKRAVFDVSVLSDGEVAYQWFLNDKAIPGQTSVSLVIDPVQADDLGNYKVDVWNSENLLTSDTAVLSEKQTAPELIWSSGNQAVASATSVTLSARFSGSLPMTFAWTKNGVPIANATSASLAFPSATVADTGIYNLTATNSQGSAHANFVFTVVDTPWSRWEWRRPGVTNPQITDILVNGTDAYAVAGNAVLHSSDGENWVRHPLPQGFIGKYIAIKDGTFVCLGQDLDQVYKVAISTNAIDWSVYQTTGDSMGSGVKISVFKSQYIAANTVYDGQVFRSSDGIDWTKIQTTDYLGQIVNMSGKGQPATDGNKLILSSPRSSGDGSIFLHVSDDGITWTEQRIFPANMVNFHWSPGAVLYAFGKFHCFGNRTYTSTDGLNWEFSSTFNWSAYADSFFGIAGTDLYAFRQGSPVVGVVNPTGQITWMQIAVSSDSVFTAVANYGSKFIFGSDRGYLKLVSQVSDLHFSPDPMSSFHSMEFIDNLFYVFSRPPASGTTINYNSGDGVTWKAANSLDNYPIVYLGEAYGQYWAKTQSTEYDKLIGFNPLDTRPSVDPLHADIKDPSCIQEAEDGTALGIFGILTGPKKLYHRLNAESPWTAVSFPSTLPTKVTRVGNRWFGYTPATTTTALLYSSTNGTSWSSTGITGSNAIFTKHQNVIYCHYQTGTQTSVLMRKSTNGGSTWSAAQTNTGLPVTTQNIFAKRIFSYGGYMVMLPLAKFPSSPGAPISRIYYSTDGVAWIEGSLPMTVVDMAVGNGKIVGITTNGGIIESGSPHPGRNAPQVQITTPQPSGTHLLDSTIFVEGTLSDPEDGSASYQAFLDGDPVASGSGTDFRFPVTPYSLDGHTLTVYATDSQGLKQMDSIRINVVLQDPRNLLHQAEGKTFIPSSHAVVFDGVFYVASGSTLYRSLDGVSWQQIAIPSFTYTIQAIASGNGALVLQFTNGGIITTRDGYNWTHFQPNQKSYYETDPIRFQNGVFITTLQTISIDSGVMISEDGFSWTVRKSFQSNRLTHAVISAEGVMVGIRNSPQIVERSTNSGTSWQPISEFPSSGSTGIMGYHMNGKFVLIVPSIGKILTSPDAYDWTEHDLPAGTGTSPSFVLEGNMLFLGTAQELLYASVDGISWNELSHPLKPSVVCHSRGVFLSISGNDLVRSGDGVTWFPIAKPFTAANVTKILGNSEAHLVIDNLGATWISKDNGNSWTACLTGGSLPAATTRNGREMIQLGNRLIAGGNLMVSSNDDGESWAAISIDGSAPPTNMQMVHMRASADKVIGITYAFNSYKVVYTTDGSNFSSIPALPNQEWVDLSWNGSEWMLLAKNGDLFNSLDDGATWQAVTAADSLTTGSSLTWFNDRWVIIGRDGTTSYYCYNLSSAGVFTKHQTLSLGSSSSTLVAHNKLMTWSSGGQVFFTADGNTWTSSYPGSWASGSSDFFEIYHTSDGFTVIGGSKYFSHNFAYTSGTDALSWVRTALPYRKFTAYHNMGDRLFAFSDGGISEIYSHDLSLVISSLPDATVGVGDTVQATVTISNHGVTTPEGSRWAVRAWLSPASFFGNGRDVPVGEFEIIGNLPVKGASNDFIVDFTLPNEIPTGDNFLVLSLVSLDGIRENNNPNNTSISKTAAINVPQWEFSAAANGNGQINRDFAVTRYPHKSLVSMAATAGKGAVFTNWSGDAYSPNNQITILMDGNKSVQANFSNRATLQVFVSGMGEVTGLAELGSYPVGDTANITASPAASWEFSHWSGATDVQTPAIGITMDAPKSATAHFILPMTSWKGGYFTPEQLADDGISGDQADPDKDGIPTWIEYIHGSDPLNKNSTGRSPIKTLDGHLICTYTRNIGAGNGASVTCQAGHDLTNWDALDLEERIISTVNGIETVEARLPMDGKSKGFIRFNYEPPQP